MFRVSLSSYFLFASAIVGASPRPLEPGEAVSFARPSVAGASAETVPVEGRDFDEATRFVVTGEGPPHEVRHVVKPRGAVAEGDALLLTVWIRCESAGGKTGSDGNVKVRMIGGGWGDAGKRLVWTDVRPGPNWRQRHLKAKAKFAVPDGRLTVALHLNDRPQVVDVGPVAVVNYGPVALGELPDEPKTYDGHAPDAPWRAAAAERIAKLRTGPLEVRVVDRRGRPVAGAEVDVRMTRHAFGFGSLCDLTLLAGAEEDFPIDRGKRGGVHTWEDALRFREYVAENFSLITPGALIPFSYRGHRGAVRKERRTGVRSGEFNAIRGRAYDRTWPFLEQHGIEARGHFLTWGAIESFKPTAIPHDRPSHERWLKKTLAEFPAEVGDRVREWDTINHPCGWGLSLEKLYGGLDMHVEIMRRARESAPPSVRHYVNEGHVLADGSRVDDFVRVLKYLNEHGQRPDGAGMMSHLSYDKLTGIDAAYALFDRLGKYADRLALTELDVHVAGDDRLGADYLRDVMTIAFSHPQMEGIVTWGFWEGAMWRKPASLVARDWTPTDYGEAWLKLVKNDWWTEETVMTDADGRAVVPHGYFGDYTLSASAGRRDGVRVFEHLADGGPVEILVR